MSRRLLLAVFVASLASGQAAVYEAVEPHMGALFRIKLYAASEDEAKRAFAAAFARVTVLDETLSDYKPESELSRLTRIAIGHPVPISGDLQRVLIASQRLAQQTNGAFDITVGPLSHLWRQARRRQQVPDAAAIADAKAHCGYRKLHVDADAHTAWVDEPGMLLDVGAIGKGDAAEQALNAITQQGVRSALVAASGDLAFSDAPPGETGWKIGLDSFDQPEAPLARILVLTHRAVSTAGAQEQHLDQNGKRYSHIINPFSGNGITDPITVSVVAQHGLEADGLDTAISLIGPKAGLELLKNYPGAQALLLIQKDGRPKLIESSGFQALTRPLTPSAE
jgi:thiamine biosynthesis lipoprotein